MCVTGHVRLCNVYVSGDVFDCGFSVFEGHFYAAERRLYLFTISRRVPNCRQPPPPPASHFQRLTGTGLLYCLWLVYLSPLTATAPSQRLLLPGSGR